MEMNRFNTYGLGKNTVSQLVPHAPGFYILINERTFDRGIKLHEHIESFVAKDLQRDILNRIGTSDADSFCFFQYSTFDEAKKEYETYKKYMEDK